METKSIELVEHEDGGWSWRTMEGETDGMKYDTKSAATNAGLEAHPEISREEGATGDQNTHGGGSATTGGVTGTMQGYSGGGAGPAGPGSGPGSNDAGVGPTATG